MTTTQYNIEETLDNWFDRVGLYTVSLKAETRPDEYERPHLYMAKGTFKPCAFDRKEDGLRLTLAYEDLAFHDPRFENTKLSFPTDTTFKIV